MPILEKHWMTIDGHCLAEDGGLLIEHGGPHEQLSEMELKAALIAVENLRNASPDTLLAEAEDEGEAAVAVLLTSDGRRIDLGDRAESYLLNALECHLASGSYGRPFDGLIDGLIGQRIYGRIDKDAAMREIEEFENQWQTLNETIQEAAQRYPDLVHAALDEIKSGAVEA